MTRPIIIGGGLAGASAATRLAQLGHAPLLLEREPGPHHKICGEFLSVEATSHLAALGFDVARLGGARIDTMRLHIGRRTATAKLPFVATGITRQCLDAALLDYAAEQGAQIQRGTSVRNLEAAHTHGPGPILLATGKHELRGHPRDPSGTISDLIGFKQFFRATPALARALSGAIDVTAFAGGYAGLQCVENHRLNLCLLVDRAHFKALGGSWTTLFAALLNEPGLALLADAEPLLEKPLTIAAVPYGFLAKPSTADSLWRLGDQAAVIPSFCGDGMAIALHSGRLAADMLTAGHTPQQFQSQLHTDVARQVRLATTLQRFATTAPGRFALITGLTAVPAALATLARWTRVEPAALARAGA
nr:FAD-dependent monooxygenase [Polymorphobacter sp.]